MFRLRIFGMAAVLAWVAAIVMVGPAVAQDGQVISDEEVFGGGENTPDILEIIGGAALIGVAASLAVTAILKIRSQGHGSGDKPVKQSNSTEHGVMRHLEHHKLVVGTVALVAIVLAYLWTGGVYEMRSFKGGQGIWKVNKITGSVTFCHPRGCMDVKMDDD